MNTQNTKTGISVGDLLPSITCSGAHSSVYFNPDDLSVYEFSNVGSGSPMRAWNGQDLFLGNVPLDAHSGEWLEDVALGMAETLCSLAAEHEEFWDGNNHRGRLTDYGHELLENLQEDWSEAMQDCPSRYSPDDYFCQMDWRDTAGEILRAGCIKTWASDTVSEAEGDGAFLDYEELREFAQSTLETLLAAYEEWDQEDLDADALEEIDQIQGMLN